MRKQNTFEKTFAYGLMGFVAIFTLLPYYLMLVMGTHSNAELFASIKVWFGDNLRENYDRLMQIHYWKYFVNSLIIAVPGTVLTVLSGSMGGFALAKYNFRGKKFLVNFVFVTIMLPGSLGTIAWVWQMKQFGWINTYWPFIIPVMGNTYAVYWFMQVAKGAIPNEILESARVDGAGEFRIFAQIASPYLVPGAISLALLNFVGCWNSFLGPSLIIKKEAMYTVPLGVATIGTLFRAEYSTQILGMSIATIPLLIVFACTAKHFIAGVTAGAVKG